MAKTVFGETADFTEQDKEKFPFLFEDDEPTDEGTVEASAEEAQEAAPAGETQQEAAPAAAETPEVQEEQVAVADTTAQDEAYQAWLQGTPEGILFAGKYRDVPQLEKGYRNATDQARRSRESAKAYEEAAATAQMQLQEQQRQLTNAAMVIRQLQYEAQQRAAQPEPQYDEYGNPVPQPAQAPQPGQRQLAPEVQEMRMRQLVQSQTEDIRAQVAREYEEAAAQRAREDAVMGFFEKHPDIEPYSQADAEVRQTLRALDEAWADDEPVVENPEVLEIALEASKDPELLRVLQLNPQFVDSEEGMELARMQAAWLRGNVPVTRQTQQVPASQVGQRKPPHVERASTANPGVSDSPPDPWQDAVVGYRKEKEKGKGIW